MRKKLLELIRRILGMPPSPSSSWIRYKDYISIHPSAIIDPIASVKIYNLPPQKRICIFIDAGAQIFGSLVLLRSDATIKIGKNSQLGNSLLVCSDEISIGESVLISWGVTIMDTDAHSSNWHQRSADIDNFRRGYNGTEDNNVLKYHNWHEVKRAPVCIGDNAWLGFGSSILKGVNIGAGSIIGAGSVVRNNIQSGVIALGNPCIEVKKIPHPN